LPQLGLYISTLQSSFARILKLILAGVLSASQILPYLLQLGYAYSLTAKNSFPEADVVVV
jgi:hypothetical protein